MVKITRVDNGTIEPAAGFASLAEEAAYWDSHSAVADRERPVAFHDVQKADTLTIRFTKAEIDALRAHASRKGMGASTLARMWIKEHLGR